MSLKKLKNRLLKDKAFREEYYRHDIASEIADSVFRSRVSKGISQEKLSKLVGTKQSSIARLEAGKNLPSLRFLEKIAMALGTKLIAPKFEMLEDTPSADLNFDIRWFSAPRPIEAIPSYSSSEGGILEAVKALNS